MPCRPSLLVTCWWLEWGGTLGAWNLLGLGEFLGWGGRGLCIQPSKAGLQEAAHEMTPLWYVIQNFWRFMSRELNFEWWLCKSFVFEKLIPIRANTFFLCEKQLVSAKGLGFFRRSPVCTQPPPWYIYFFLPFLLLVLVTLFLSSNWYKLDSNLLLKYLFM